MSSEEYKYKQQVDKKVLDISLLIQGFLKKKLFVYLINNRVKEQTISVIR